MPYATTDDGMKLYFEETGEGAPIVFVHEFAADHRSWEMQMRHFGQRYRCITYGARGYPPSDVPEKPESYSQNRATDDILAVMDHLGIDKAVIGGLSLGGYMSLAFNLAHPSMVRALMLFDTGPGYKNPVGREGWNVTAMKRAETFEAKGLDALGGSAEVRVSQHRSAQGLAHAARGMLAQFDSRIIESLEHIVVPTLVLVGEKDQPFLGATDYMANKIPNATKAVIADAGHASNIDQPAEFNRAVMAFLGGLTLSA